MFNELIEPGAVYDDYSACLSQGYYRIANSIDNVTAQSDIITIFPNPTKDNATIIYSGKSQKSKLVVSDLNGKLIFSTDLLQHVGYFNLDTKNLMQGIYSLTIEDAVSNSSTYKLVVIR